MDPAINNCTLATHVPRYGGCHSASATWTHSEQQLERSLQHLAAWSSVNLLHVTGALGSFQIKILKSTSSIEHGGYATPWYAATRAAAPLGNARFQFCSLHFSLFPLSSKKKAICSKQQHSTQHPIFSGNF